MATNNDWLPTSHEALYDKGLQTKSYAEGHLGDIGAGKTAEWINSDFKVKWQDFANAFLAWQNPSQRTPQKVAALREKEYAFKTAYREFYRYVKNNPVVTDEMLVAMGFPPHSDNKPTPAPVPTSYPIAKIDIGTVSRLTVHYADSATGKKGKPQGVAGAVIHWAILPAPPTDYAELFHSVLNTNSPLVLDFAEEERDRIAYFRLAWQNVRGEKGAYGEIVSARIP
ncbi:MAG: hypothetical protein LBN27_10070 [Prevotellaceae bacterium]|jgi:hypothetical protein|nr:hypothetical protein [Prevotellaceae bacterium]